MEDTLLSGIQGLDWYRIREDEFAELLFQARHQRLDHKKVEEAQELGPALGGDEAHNDRPTGNAMYPCRSTGSRWCPEVNLKWPLHKMCIPR